MTIRKTPGNPQVDALRAQLAIAANNTSSGGVTSVVGVEPGINASTVSGVVTIRADTILISSLSQAEGPASNTPLGADQAVLVEFLGGNLSPASPAGYFVSAVMQCEYTGGGAGAEAVFNIFSNNNSEGNTPIVQYSQWIPAGGASTVTWSGLLNLGFDPSTAMFFGITAAGVNVTVLGADGIGNEAGKISVVALQG
jgi:hypothetical protein